MEIEVYKAYFDALFNKKYLEELAKGKTFFYIDPRKVAEELKEKGIVL